MNLEEGLKKGIDIYANEYLKLKNAYKNHCYAFHFNNDYVWGSIHT